MTTEHPLTAIVGDITAVEADAIVNVTNDAYLTRWAISGRNPVHRWSSGLRILCAAVTSPAPAVLVCALWCDGTVQWWLRPLLSRHSGYRLLATPPDRRLVAGPRTGPTPSWRGVTRNWPGHRTSRRDGSTEGTRGR
jgi:hypothetical protein